MIRFTPRKPASTWSAVNIKRVEVLIEQRLMQPTGLAAFRARRDTRSAIYSYEQRPTVLPDAYDALLKSNSPAAAFFAAQPASYQRAAIWWIVSAKQEATRRRRLQQLIADSLSSKRLKQFRKP